MKNDLKSVVAQLSINELLELRDLVSSRIDAAYASLPMWTGDGSEYDRLAAEAFREGKPVIVGGEIMNARSCSADGKS